MSAVTVQEVVEALSECAFHFDNQKLKDFVRCIEAHGIAPPDGWVLVPRVSTTEMDFAGANSGLVTRHEAEAIWNYMLDAAPDVKP